MQIFLAVIAITCLSAVVYSYVIYPVLLIVVAGAVQMSRDIRFVLGKRDTRKTDVYVLPSIAVVISAFNEERFLQRRIDNVLACDYPPDLVRVYIGSDGSSDATPQILSTQTDPRIAPHAFAANRGKASVLNDLVSFSNGEILVFSDANTFFERDALRHLVGHFQNSKVGGVSGELRLTTAGGDNQDSLYWRVEQLLKFFEGRIGGLLGANGAIYAIRRTLWKPIAADTICDDFCIAMNVAAAGYRLAYDPNAVAQEETPHTISEEYHRRIRIGIGNFQALFRFPEYLLCTSWATKFTYLSHKVLRWITPHLVLMALAASSLLAFASHAWLALAGLVLFGVVLGYATYRLTHHGRRLPKVLRLVAFFYALNEAFLLASWKYLRGDFRGSWRRTAR